jgi:hypothetical protein
MAASIELQPGCLIMFERSSGDQVGAALQILSEVNMLFTSNFSSTFVLMLHE